MKPFLQEAGGILSHQAGDAPWSSKSVLAALAVIVIGLGVWCSGLKHSPQNDRSLGVTNAPGPAPTGSLDAPGKSDGNGGKPFPFYVRIGASYVAGFFIGWLFRKLTRLILVASALMIALLTYGKLAGCEMTHTQEEVKRSGEWAQHEANATEGYLLHMLPSVTAGGAGIFLGFRRRGQATAPAKPVD